MIVEKSTVKSIVDDGVWVETIKSSSCMACSARSGCGQSILSRLLGQKSWIFARIEGGSLELDEFVIGDEVEIAIAENAVLLASLLSYIVPVICLVIGAALAASWGELWAFLAATLGLLIGVIISRCIQIWGLNRDQFEPRVIRKLLPLEPQEVLFSDRPNLQQ